MTREPEDMAVKVCPRSGAASHLFCRTCAEIAAAIRAAVEEERESAARSVELLGPVDYAADSQAAGYNAALSDAAAAIRARGKA